MQVAEGWWLDNPIANMPGPDFLFVYGVLSILTILFIRIKATRLDPTYREDLPPLPVPGKLSPIELACLNGSTNSTLGTILFGLWNRRLLEVRIPAKGKPFLRKSPTPADVTELLPIERDVYIALPDSGVDDKPAKKSYLALLTKVREFAKTLEPALKDELILVSDETRRQARQLFYASAPWLLLVGGYKLVVALEKGKHNVLFLVAFMLLGMIGLRIAVHLPRLTQRGTEFLERMKGVFRDVPSQTTLAVDGGIRPTLTRADTAAVFGVALFGLGALAGTPIADAWKWLAPQIAVDGCSTAGWGGSCGGGGGGCGGGGCGGGGCGGCGS